MMFFGMGLLNMLLLIKLKVMKIVWVINIFIFGNVWSCIIMFLDVCVL